MTGEFSDFRRRTELIVESGPDFVAERRRQMSWQRRQFSLSQSTSNSFTCYGWSSIIQGDASSMTAYRQGADIHSGTVLHLLPPQVCIPAAPEARVGTLHLRGGR
jgi:hypothetical protein